VHVVTDRKSSITAIRLPDHLDPLLWERSVAAAQIRNARDRPVGMPQSEECLIVANRSRMLPPTRLREHPHRRRANEKRRKIDPWQASPMILPPPTSRPASSAPLESRRR